MTLDDTALKMEELLSQMQAVCEAFSELVTAAAEELSEAFHTLYEALYGPENPGEESYGKPSKRPYKPFQRPSWRLPRGLPVAYRSYRPDIPTARHLPYQMRRYS